LTIAQELLEELKKDNRIRYCIFSIERGKHQNEFSFHFQGYIEFRTKVDVNSFNKDFNFDDIQNRKGTQQQAIDYIRKERTKLSDKVFEFGTPKRMINIYNIRDADIPKSIREQETLIDIRVSEGYYQRFEDIKKDFHHIFIKQEK
jgi:hypothetical protein